MGDRYADLSRAFLGVGVAFPFETDADQALAMVTYEDDIRQAIQIILATNPGERVMRPDFGAGLQDFVFEPISTTTLALIRNRVQAALVDWEPRIDVEDVSITPNQTQRSRLTLDIRYRVRATNTLTNLVYPFYLQEGVAT